MTITIKLRCRNLVRQLAATLDIWQWLKKDCLKCGYNEIFTPFKETIDGSLRKNKKELDSLLNLKFQLFDNVHYPPSIV